MDGKFWNKIMLVISLLDNIILLITLFHFINSFFFSKKDNMILPIITSDTQCEVEKIDDAQMYWNIVRCFFWFLFVLHVLINRFNV